MTELSLSVTETDGWIVLRVSGDLDITCVDQFTALATERVSNEARVIVDLAALSFLDSAGLGALLNLWKRLQRGGGELVLAGADYRSARVLWVTGLAARLPLADSVEAALG